MANIQPLTQEEIVRLLDDIKRNPKKYETEAKFILFLNTYTTQSSLVDCWREFEIIFGEAEMICLSERHQEGIPEHSEKDYAIIPKTKPTIILEKEKRYVEGSENDYFETLYIFTGNRWVKVEID